MFKLVKLVLHNIDDTQTFTYDFSEGINYFIIPIDKFMKGDAYERTSNHRENLHRFSGKRFNDNSFNQRKKAYELVRSGAIHSVRVGNSYRTPHEALTEFLAKTG